MPTAAPPPPRAEKAMVRAGFEWIPGRWDWRAGAWAWVPGHLERAKAGRHWHPGRWENHRGRWAYVQGTWEAGGAVGVGVSVGGSVGVSVGGNAGVIVADGRPHAAPPPRRTERALERAGFVWIPGRWDWRANAWAWIPGHLERARAHKKWQPGHWELQGNAYVLVNGAWVDETAVPPPPPGPPGPPPGTMPPPTYVPHHWHLDRPVVSSYWPVKGSIGTRVVIRGRNLPLDGMLVWDGRPIRAAKIRPNKIVFVVPPGSTTGMLQLRREHEGPLAIGMFEVAANYDPVAEQRRIDQENRKRAEAEWAARQKALSRSRAARQAALEQQWAQREATREQRREQRIAQIRAKWDRAFLADADTQAELTLHAQRVAELQRAKEMAELADNGKLAIRIDMDVSREQTRHDRRMAALHASFGMKGATP